MIKRELRRRSAIEPVIGHMKTDGHLGRCHLKGRDGHPANVVLTAVGHNLPRLAEAFAAPNPERFDAAAPSHTRAQTRFLTEDYLIQLQQRKPLTLVSSSSIAIV
ncbi:hypothetical protein ACVWZ6_001780 [Bradyrhizobium sp. GM6.1]